MTWMVLTCTVRVLLQEPDDTFTARLGENPLEQIEKTKKTKLKQG